MATGCDAWYVFTARLCFVGVETLSMLRAIPFVTCVAIVRNGSLRMQRVADCRPMASTW